ncbi:uncharacterized protein DUF2778 [Erwinia sp. AG740]|nr:uncharacterized protein DUF2778 [Erwinia sp. AG740]
MKQAEAIRYISVSVKMTDSSELPILSLCRLFTNIFSDSKLSFVEKAAIPPGTYWIVERPKGSILNQLRAEAIDMAHLYKNHYSEWFGLYNSQTMSNHVYINGVRRGSFRLHPRNTDGTGVSWGCITFYNPSDFQLLRRPLLGGIKVAVPGGKGLKAYGRVDVRGRPDFSKCDLR